MSTESNNNALKNIQVIGALVASIAIPLVIALIGHWYTDALKERELRIRYVELAISILNHEPKDHTREIRNWAIEIVNEHSSVKMSSDTIVQLQNRQLIEDALDGNTKSSSQLFDEIQMFIKQQKERTNAN